MFFKLILFGLVAGTIAYMYDQNTAPRHVYDAEFQSVETEDRCKNNHESMCKYFLTVKLEDPEKLTYKFRVPLKYFHSMSQEELKSRVYPVEFKEKKIFPAAIVGLEKEYQTEIDEAIAEEP